MLVATEVIDDLSYDKQWSRSNDIYRIISINKMGDGLYDRSSNSFVGLKTSRKIIFLKWKPLPEFQITPPGLSWIIQMPMVLKCQRLMRITSLWKMLDVQVLEGNPKKYIAGDNTNLVITESFRRKFFSNQNPVGKIIYSVPVYNDKPGSYVITGVIKDLPSNSVFGQTQLL